MKRFTETTKWQDPWFAELSAEQKLLWIYLCDNCDNSGVIDFSERIAKFLINGKEDLDIKVLSDRVEVLPNGKLFIHSFVGFQFGVLKETSNLHKNVIQMIKKNGLEDKFFKGSYTLHKGLIKGTSKGKGKGVGISKGVVKVVNNNFEDFYNLYPLKKSKQKAEESYLKVIKEKKATHEQIMFGVERLIEAVKQGLQDIAFIKHPPTWLNQGCWNDEYIKKGNNNDTTKSIIQVGADFVRNYKEG